MSYGVRRRIANTAAAVAAAGLTAAAASALGGHAQTIPNAGSASAARPRTRTVVRDVTVRRIVHATAAPLAAPRPDVTPRTTAGTTPPPATSRAGRPRHTSPRRRGVQPPARAISKPAGEPAATGGGYRAFASATAAMAGDLVLARSGSGVALDGHPLDVADELGTLAVDLPGGRTAFGRAISAPGDAAATSSSPPAGPTASQDSGRGANASTTARTDERGSCVHGAPISSAEARAASATAGALGLSGGHSRTESLLDDMGERQALVSRATVTPPEVSLAPGTPAEITVRFLGPVTLLARAGGTPGSAAVQLGPRGDDAGAPLVEVVTGTRTTRFTAADLFDGGGRTLHLGATTVLLGGAPHAWRSAVDAPPLVGGDGTFASAAADVLTVRADDGPAVVLGHLEVSAVVPPRGVLCPS